MLENQDHHSADSTPAPRHPIDTLKYTQDVTRITGIAIGLAGAALLLTTARDAGARDGYNAGLSCAVGAIALGCTGAIVAGIRGLASQQREWIEHVKALEQAEREQFGLFRHAAGDELGPRRKGYLR